MPSFATLILAAGKSERMGMPKIWLPYKKGNFLDQIITTYNESNIRNIYVIINVTVLSNFTSKVYRYASKGVNFVLNTNPNSNRLQSVQIGLNKISSDFVFIQNIDSPFVSKKTIQQLALNNCDFKTLIPTYNNQKGHPILISKYIQHQIINTDNKDKTLRDVIYANPCSTLEINDKHILTNINYKEDYQNILNELV
ncbi:MAG: nucleotidyltransferase family protein [Vicingaceae bacterium]